MDIKRKSPSNSATLYKVGTIKVGNDGNKWIITENKNNVNKWQLYKKSSKKCVAKKSSKNGVAKKSSKKSVAKISIENGGAKKPKRKFLISLDTFFGFKVVSEKQLAKIISKDSNISKIYKILIKKIIPAIKKFGIDTYIIPLPLSKDDKYWSDYASAYINYTYDKEFMDSNKVHFTFYLNHDGNTINQERPIRINYNFDDKLLINIVSAIVGKFINEYFQWDSANNIMEISYEKNKK